MDTGERTLILENEGFLGFVIDDDYNVRFAMRLTPDGGNEILKEGGLTNGLLYNTGGNSWFLSKFILLYVALGGHRSQSSLG